jgi:hypothetical protein
MGTPSASPVGGSTSVPRLVVRQMQSAANPDKPLRRSIIVARLKASRIVEGADMQRDFARRCVKERVPHGTSRLMPLTARKSSPPIATLRRFRSRDFAVGNQPVRRSLPYAGSFQLLQTDCPLAHAGGLFHLWTLLDP